jgi:hypothetical protein
MSQPAFVPERREVWFTDGTSGFYALRVNQDVWDGATSGTATTPTKASRRCSGRRRFAVHVRLPRHAHVKRVHATLAGKRVRGAKRAGRFERLVVDLRTMRKRTATLKVAIRLRSGRIVRTKRVYHPCTGRGKVAKPAA